MDKTIGFCYYRDMSKRVNHEIISLEEAQKICSKGSHRLVKWSCPDCGIEQIKTFKQALKVKRCKPCNNIIRPKPDYKGANNPAWKGGRPKCETCSKELGSRYGRFCPKCAEEYVINKFKRHRLTDEEKAKRKDHRYDNDNRGRTWARKVKERANFTCQCCQKRTPGKLVSHHLNSWGSHPEQRYDLENGVCLCHSCHWIFHRKYGAGNNTREQYLEFLASFLI